MKRIPPLPLTLLLCTALLGGLSSEAANEMTYKRVDPADPAIAPIRHAGEQSITLIADRMISEVNQVLATKSPEDAIDALHLKGFSLPEAAPGSPVVTTIRRTSLRVRNPANAPDKADLAVLQLIRRNLEVGESPPKLLMLHVDARVDAPEEWRVYRPIGITPACLACHGSTESMSPAVKAKLEHLYPEDKAVNYAAREWRGVIRVSLTAAPAAKP